MAAFNLKKSAQSHGNYEAMLKEDNDNKNKTLKDNSTTNVLLDEQRKGCEAETLNVKLESKRTGSADAITEVRMDKEAKMFNEKRNKTTWDGQIKPMDLLAEARDQKKLADIKKAEDGLAGINDDDTKFWDEYVNKQLIGEKTTIVSNVQKSQLQNHPDRFAGMEKVKITVDPIITADETLSQGEKIEKMAESMLRDADAMLYFINYKAAKENRELTAAEIQQVNNINSAKSRIMAGYIEIFEE